MSDAVAKLAVVADDDKPTSSSSSPKQNGVNGATATTDTTPIADPPTKTAESTATDNKIVDAKNNSTSAAADQTTEDDEDDAADVADGDASLDEDTAIQSQSNSSLDDEALIADDKDTENVDADDVDGDNADDSRASDTAKETATALAEEEADEEPTEEVDSHSPTLDAIAEDSQEDGTEDANPATATQVDDVEVKASEETVERAPSSNGAADDADDADDVGADAEEVAETAGQIVESEEEDEAVDDDDEEEDEEEQQQEEISQESLANSNPLVGAADEPMEAEDADQEGEDDEDEDDDDEGAMAIDEDANNSTADNNNSMDDNDVQHVPIVEEVHAISDSDDDDDGDDDEGISNAAAGDVQHKDDSNSHGSNMPEMEHMDVDGRSPQENGHADANSEADADAEAEADKPVSIGSDSDAEPDDGDATAAAPTNGVQHSPTSAAEPIKVDTEQPAAKSSVAAEGGAADDDDEDDCMVIEDDDDEATKSAAAAAAAASLLSPRRSGRSRKSVVQVRQFDNKFDDDIEEITDDLPTAKRLKSGNAATPMSITIQDARSLAIDPLAGVGHQQQQQQQFNADGSRKKEPTLVIIDTNQLMAGRTSAATAASVQALQAQNISVHPVAMSAAGSSATAAYPTNLRASITPVSMATITKSPHQPQHHLNNNSAGHATITKSTLLPGGTTITAAGSSLANNTANLLPALSDDMFVLEAPSFIVPYIYEKPPGDNLRDIVERIGRELADQKKQEDIEVAENEAKELEAMSAEQRKLAELARAVDANKKKAAAKRGKPKSGDESWDESDTSTDDEASDTDQPQRTKVLIQEADTDPLNASLAAGGAVALAGDPNGGRRDNYFESPLGRFFMDIGVNLVQEHVQTDLLRQQKKKLHREGDAAAPSVKMAISSLTKNLEHSKTKNEIFKFETKRCEFCNFKSESALAMAHHYEAPHLNGQMYRCNFCAFEARPPYDILFHMEAMHNVKARVEKGQTYHQCPNCPFEDNGKSKLARHAAVCAKKFRPEVNLNPPLDWEPPAKIPRIKPRHGLVGTATAYQAMAAQAQRSATNAAAAAALTMQQRQNMANAAAMNRQRGRPQQQQQMMQQMPQQQQHMMGQQQQKQQHVVNVGGSGMRNNIHQQIQQQQQQLQQQHHQLSRQQLANLSVPSNYHLNASGQFVQTPSKSASKNTQQQQQQPSISITALPRQPNSAGAGNLNAVALQLAAAQSKAAATMTGLNAANAAAAAAAAAANIKPGQAVSPGQKSFVICEICDSYIKDLDQLRNHMQWMHKVKIHPKMIYNRPPLNCQKCQFRFFTDQGLERHLLGSHGLVTSSMQEAANKGKDAGRCPVCGRMYQWKLLNHVSRDHNMTLKPAHLSYKCTVCTATFGMYKQFENHVYSAHSTVAKKAMDGKTKGSGGSTAGQSTSAVAAAGSSSSLSTPAGSSKAAGSSDSLLKPLKINDEITIIPQPATSRQSRGGGGGASGAGSGAGSSSNMDSHVIEIL